MTFYPETIVQEIRREFELVLNEIESEQASTADRLAAGSEVVACIQSTRR